MEVNGIGHEVMVSQCGSHWRLILRRTDAGPMELPAVYGEEQEAVQAARDFIRMRRADPRYANEVWFCLALPESDKAGAL
jgi:hypothetical protein